MNNFFLSREAEEFLRELRNELLLIKKDPDTIILDEPDLCEILHCSKRHAANLRTEGKIRYSKDGGKIYYKLSWVVEYIDNHRIDIPSSSLLNRK